METSPRPERSPTKRAMVTVLMFASKRHLVLPPQRRRERAQRLGVVSIQPIPRQRWATSARSLCTSKPRSHRVSDLLWACMDTEPGNATPTDSRSPRIRLIRGGSHLLKRVRSSSCASACRYKAFLMPLSRMVTRHGTVATSAGSRRRLIHTGYKSNRPNLSGSEATDERHGQRPGPCRLDQLDLLRDRGSHESVVEMNYPAGSTRDEARPGQRFANPQVLRRLA